MGTEVEWGLEWNVDWSGMWTEVNCGLKYTGIHRADWIGQRTELEWIMVLMDYLVYRQIFNANTVLNYNVLVVWYFDTVFEKGVYFRKGPELGLSVHPKKTNGGRSEGDWNYIKVEDRIVKSPINRTDLWLRIACCFLSERHTVSVIGGRIKDNNPLKKLQWPFRNNTLLL